MESEIIHKPDLGAGMTTICGKGIRTTSNKDGTQSYSLRWSLDPDKVNCEECLKNKKTHPK